MSVQVERRVFTVEEYHRMAEAGILSEDDRVELIDGEIIKMSPIGSRHVACVNRLNAVLTSAIGRAAIVSVQNPFAVNDYSEPQPDIVILKPRNDFYAHSLPTAQDVLLIIEVADTSLSYDRNVKVPAYARAGVPEVWIADLAGGGIEAYSEPVSEVYQNIRWASRGQISRPEQLPGISIGVDAILG
jgi:Uma2 family endonuclease